MAERLHSTLTGAVQKFSKDFVTRADEQDGEERNVLKARAKAYRLVDQRDAGRCRACFVRVDPSGPRKKRPEHHHINGRGGVTKEVTSNIALVCVGCHELKHVKRTLTITGNADKALRCDDGRRKWVSLPPNTVLKLVD